MRRAMDRLNPYIMLVYYVLIMTFGVLLKNPLHLGVMLIGGIVMAVIVAGVKVTLRTLGYSMIMVLLIVLINPLVSHEGVTKVLEIGDFYITLEAIVYGLVAGMMFLTVFMWFVSFNVVMTGDKYIYVLGRFLPSFSLLISLTLRLIPELSREYEEQKASVISMGMFSCKGFVSKLKCNAYVLKSVIRRSIENSVIRADSMEARGYGIAHRSCYLRYRTRAIDIVFLMLTLLGGGMVVAMHILKWTYASYYPIININIENNATYTIVSLLVVIAYVCLPIVIELMEEISWKRYERRILE